MMTATAPRCLTAICLSWAAMTWHSSQNASAQTTPEPVGPRLVVPGSVPVPTAEPGLTPPPAAPQTSALQPAAGPAEAPAVVGAADSDNEDFEVYTRGPLHEAFATPVTNDPVEGPLAPKAPPEAVDEVPPEDRPDGQNVIWVPGYWAWDEQLNEFLWVSGLWRDVPPGRRWVPGYWTASGENHRWVAGMWIGEEAEALNYLPQPPASLERGPSAEAPSENHFWVPGSWEYVDVNYRWRPGYWVPQQESWIWVPSRYVMTPAGCVFVPGYWDYAVVERGVCFAPVRFRRPVVVTYTPVVVVNTWQNFWVHLWVRPRHCHYVFGDYYGPQYASAGFVPWCDFHGHRGYDPIFVHDRWRYGPDFHVRLRGWNSYYASHIDHRPRVTLREQQQFHAGHGGDRRTPQPQIAVTLNQVVVQKSSPIHFHRINNETRVAVATQSRQSRDLVRDRAKLEGIERRIDNDRRGDNRPGNDNDRGNRGPDIGGRGPRDNNDRDRERGPGRGSLQLPRDAQLQARRNDPESRRDDKPSGKTPPSTRPGLPGSISRDGRNDQTPSRDFGGRPGFSGNPGKSNQNPGIVGKTPSLPSGNDRRDGDRDNDRDRDGRRGNDGIGMNRPGATLPGLNPGQSNQPSGTPSNRIPGTSTLPGLTGRGSSGRENDGRGSGRSGNDRGNDSPGSRPPSVGNPVTTPGLDGRRNNGPRTEVKPNNNGKSAFGGPSGGQGAAPQIRGQAPGKSPAGQPSPPRMQIPGSDRGSSGRTGSMVPGSGGRSFSPGMSSSPQPKQPSSNSSRPKSDRERGASLGRPSGGSAARSIVSQRPSNPSPPRQTSSIPSKPKSDRDRGAAQPSGGNGGSRSKSSVSASSGKSGGSSGSRRGGNAEGGRSSSDKKSSGDKKKGKQ